MPTPPARRATARLTTAIVAVTLALAACASPDGATTDATSDDATTAAAPSPSSSPTPAATSEGVSPSPSEESPASSFPVTIDHTHGTTEIPSRPARVVTVGLRDQDAVLALGITPVGIRDWFGEQPDAVWPWAQDELGDAEPTVLSPDELDAEVIATLEPDVIIGVDSGLTADEYEVLSGIAPTVAQPADHPDFAVPWRERTMLVAEALGEVDQAEALVAEVEDQVAAAAADHPEFAEATAIVGLAAADGQAYAYGSDDVRAQLLRDLGLSVPEVIEEQVPEDAFFVTLSQERFDDLDADVVLWVGGDATAFDTVTSAPLYPSRLAADGRELFLPYDPLGGAMSFASVLSLPFLVDELVPQLELALDGDPATVTDVGRDAAG